MDIVYILVPGLAALLAAWLFCKTDQLRPVVLIFAPLVIGFLASVEWLEVKTLYAAADHVQSVMFRVIGQ